MPLFHRKAKRRSGGKNPLRHAKGCPFFLRYVASIGKRNQMERREFTMKASAITVLFLILEVSCVMAGKPTPPPGLIIDFALVDGSGNPYYVRPSDGNGPLVNGVDCTYAVLELTGFNVYTNNGCSTPRRFMEVNMANPALGQNPIADYV